MFSLCLQVCCCGVSMNLRTLKVLLTRVLILILVLHYIIWVKIDESVSDTEEYIVMVYDHLVNTFNDVHFI